MEAFWQGIVADWPGATEMLDTAFRLCLAALVAALPGLQREQLGTAAGLRTHMLVSLGAAAFVMAATEAGVSVEGMTRVIQGLAAGIGFLGAGAILKSKEEFEIRGLTTAASVWVTAALGTAVGAGRIFLPIAGAVLAFVILGALRPVERMMGDRAKMNDSTRQGDRLKP
jgi:putative Mg2+ transporter-C (MgtC) family protein